MTHTKKYMTTEEIMEHFGIAGKCTLYRWRKSKGFPEPVIPGKPNRWLTEDIVRWEDLHKQRQREQAALKDISV
ncbi:helix-turn-helix domain-containing protein [Vibrio mediterranei]|uniref:helix-turn-helix transcriptional regulator n=1 Tax=Vibrio mediterranei TaxID=689 RepID=UPI0038CEECFC